MEFKKEVRAAAAVDSGAVGNRCIVDAMSVYLPRRSLLLLTHEARFGWTHAIPPRKVYVHVYICMCVGMNILMFLFFVDVFYDYHRCVFVLKMCIYT
jgi:hypothetical protein